MAQQVDSDQGTKERVPFQSHLALGPPLVDYDIITRSLDFSNLTPEKPVAASSSGLGLDDQKFLLPCTFSADYAQRTQTLCLPPCSPAKNIPMLV